jgi:hypothetical protein
MAFGDASFQGSVAEQFFLGNIGAAHGINKNEYY